MVCRKNAKTTIQNSMVCNVNNQNMCFSLRRTDFPGPACSGCDGIAEFTDTLGVDLIGSVTLIIDHTASCLQE